MNQGVTSRSEVGAVSLTTVARGVRNNRGYGHRDTVKLCHGHRIIESQGWKGPTRSSSPTVLPSPLLPQATKPYLVTPHPDAS